MNSIYKKYLTTIVLIWSGCFILFLLGYILVLAPQEKTKNRIERQLAEKERIYNSALQTTRTGTKLKLNEQIELMRNNLRDFVVDFEDSANLTFDISQLANERKITSFSIETENAAGDSAVPDCNYICENRFDVAFTVGDFNQFASFLNALERHRPVIFVDEFAITRSDSDGSAHRVSMTLSVFVRKQQDS